MTRTAVFFFALLTPLIGANDATPQDQVETLATLIAKGDSAAALSLFDPTASSFAETKKDLEAIIALPNTTCTIAINRTIREDNTVRFETDWSLNMYSVQNGPLLQRTDPVAITLRHSGNSWLITSLSPLSILTPPDNSVFKRIAALATDLNEKNQSSAVGAFSSQMKAYGEIDNDIDALITQNDLLCAIDIVSDQQTGDVHTLDLDWYLQLKARTDGGPLTQRRERVKVTMKKIKTKWQIVDLDSLKILSPEVNR